MKPHVDVIELIKQCPGTTISISASDLGLFARKLVAVYRQEYERERAANNADAKEVYRDPSDVKTMLNISESTLYRMAKTGILVPVYIAGQKRYRQSDIDRIVETTK